MNIIVFDFDDTLCPSREMTYDAETFKVKLNETNLDKVLDGLDDEACLILEEAQKYAHQVCILSNGTASWVYGALGLLPKTLDFCSRKDVKILTGPDLYSSKTECPLKMKHMGFAAICDPFKDNLRLVCSIGDGLPEFLACKDYFHENAVPKCRAYRLERMDPPYMAGQLVMLRMIRESLGRYLEQDQRPYVEIHVRCSFQEKET